MDAHSPEIINWPFDSMYLHLYSQFDPSGKIAHWAYSDVMNLFQLHAAYHASLS